jgi:hypothetical protein
MIVRNLLGRIVTPVGVPGFNQITIEVWLNERAKTLSRSLRDVPPRNPLCIANLLRRNTKAEQDPL